MYKVVCYFYSVGQVRIKVRYITVQYVKILQTTHPPFTYGTHCSNSLLVVAATVPAAGAKGATVALAALNPSVELTLPVLPPPPLRLPLLVVGVTAAASPVDVELVEEVEKEVVRSDSSSAAVMMSSVGYTTYRFIDWSQSKAVITS